MRTMQRVPFRGSHCESLPRATRGRPPVHVAALEELRADDAMLVGDEGHRVGNAVRRISLGILGVQQAEAADDRRIGVREQRERDLPSFREVLEDRRGIVTQGRDPESALPERLDLALQLDELALAVQSSVRGAEEDQHEALRPAEALERVRPGVLVHCLEGGQRLTQGGAQLRRRRSRQQRHEEHQRGHGLPILAAGRRRNCEQPHSPRSCQGLA